MGVQNSKKISPETYFKSQRLYCLINSLQSHTEFVLAREKDNQSPIKNFIRQIGNLLRDKIKLKNSPSLKLNSDKENRELPLSSLIKLQDRLSAGLDLCCFFSVLFQSFKDSDKSQFDTLNLTSEKIKSSAEMIRKIDLVGRGLSTSMKDFVMSLSGEDLEWIKVSEHFLTNLEGHETSMRFLLKFSVSTLPGFTSSM